jgi:hypothetical protein
VARRLRRSWMRAWWVWRAAKPVVAIERLVESRRAREGRQGMEIKSSYVFIQIGLSTRLLRHLEKSRASVPKKELEALTKNLEKVKFAVSSAYIERSRDFNVAIKDINALNDDDQVPKDLLDTFCKRIADLEAVIFAEATTKKVFTLPERRYDVQHLMTAPEKLLKPGTFTKLSMLAQGDFQSACKCLVFGEATAAAFHILRCTEDTLKSYYFLHRKQKRLEKPMWASMLDQLKAKSKNKPPATLLKTLDIIRDSYRNPTQHPEATYTIDSAQDLFGVCLDVIGKMADEF